MSNLNTPRIVPVEKLTADDIDRLLAERQAELAGQVGGKESSVAASQALLHSAAKVDMVHGIPVTPLADLQRSHPIVPRRRESIAEPLLNVALILAGYTAAHWRVWLAPVTAIGLIAWWCFR